MSPFGSIFLAGKKYYFVYIKVMLFAFWISSRALFALVLNSELLSRLLRNSSYPWSSNSCFDHILLTHCNVKVIKYHINTNDFHQQANFGLKAFATKYIY